MTPEQLADIGEATQDFLKAVKGVNTCAGFGLYASEVLPGLLAHIRQQQAEIERLEAEVEETARRSYLDGIIY